MYDTTVPQIDPERLRDRFLLSQADIAEMCGVSLPIVRRWVAAGKLISVRLPLCQRRKLYRVEDVARFVDACSDSKPGGGATNP